MNTLLMFNEWECDELILISLDGVPGSSFLTRDAFAVLTSNAFMPLGFGGRVSSLSEAQEIMALGVEKIVVGTHAIGNPTLLTQLANEFGQQAVVAAVDFRRSQGGKAKVVCESGSRRTGIVAQDWARQAVDLGAGELLITDVDREGSWVGLDHDLFDEFANLVPVPVVAHGGASSREDAMRLLQSSRISGVGVGSLVTFCGPMQGVLVSLPEWDATEAVSTSD